MKCYTQFALTLVFLLCTSAIAAEPITFDNDSIDNAKGLKVIKSGEQYKSTPKSEKSFRVLSNIEPKSKQPLQQPIPKPRSLANIDLKVIDISGPIRANNQSIRVIEMWATWCPPCKKSIPLLTQAQQVYGKKNVVFYGFTNEANQTLVTNFVRERGATMNYNVQLDSAKKTIGPFSALWNVNSIPHVYVISHRGKIVWHGNPLDVRTFESAIQEAILYRDGTL